jgi:hypothetical protein
VNPQGHVDLAIGDMLARVGVPMLFEYGVNILDWNAKVPHYVVSIFIFADNVLSQSDAIFLFHSDDLRIFK